MSERATERPDGREEAWGFETERIGSEEWTQPDDNDRLGLSVKAGGRLAQRCTNACAAVPLVGSAARAVMSTYAEDSFSGTGNWKVEIW